MRKENFVATVNKMYEYNGYKISVKEVYKGTQKLTGIGIRRPGQIVVPTVYVENFEAEIEAAKTTKEVLKRMIEVVENDKIPSINPDPDVLFKPEFLRIAACNANAKEYLEDVPTEIVAGDIALYLRLELNETMSITVKQFMLDKMGLTKEEAFVKAKEQTTLDTPHLFEEMGMPTPPFIIASTPNKIKGAGIGLADHSVLRKMGGDVYILPSSIHEVLYMKDNGVNPEELKKMVREVNETQVAPTDRLSDNVYIYKVDTDTIEMVA